MGMTFKIICGFNTNKSCAKAIQPGYREWATAIVTASFIGWSLPQKHFGASEHQNGIIIYQGTMFSV